MSNQRRFALLKVFDSPGAIEAAQDAVGSILVDSSEINFTYTDATPAITAALIDASIAYARIANASALSVLGRATNSAGVLADIAAGSDHQVLRRSGTAVAFGAVNLAQSAAVTGDLPFANIAQITGQAVLGVSTAGAGDLAAISAGTDDRVLRQTASALNFGQLTAGMFPNTVVPDAALSSNVPLSNAANVFTALQSVNASSISGISLLVRSDYSVASNQANVTSITYGISGGGAFHANHANGTFASPSQTLSGDITGGIGSRAYHNGGAFQTSSPASIHWQATQNQTSSAYGMWLRFLTTPKGTTTRQERGGVTDNGTIWCHDTGTFDALSDAQTLPVADARFVASATALSGASFAAVSYGTGVTAGFRGLFARGTPSSPAVPQADDFLCFMGGHGYDGSAFTINTKALIGFKAAETFSSTAQGTYITFETTAATTTTRSERMRILSSGFTGVGTTSPQKNFVVSNGGAEGLEISTVDVDQLIRFLTYDRVAAGYIALRLEATQFELYAGSSPIESMRVDSNATAGNTRMLVWDVDNGQLERVSVGAADSGGAGFKVLRIPN